MFHEVPHIFGDFAVLVKKDISIVNAILLQMGTGAFAFFGAELALNNVKIDNEVVMAFVCGNFLYVSLCDILPEILQETKIGVKDIGLELIGFFAGLYLV